MTPTTVEEVIRRAFSAGYSLGQSLSSNYERDRQAAMARLESLVELGNRLASPHATSPEGGSR